MSDWLCTLDGRLFHRFVIRLICGVILFFTASFAVTSALHGVRLHYGEQIGNITIKGSASTDEIEQLQKEISKVPEWISQRFIDCGGVIYLSERPLSDVFSDLDPKDGAIGVFSPTNKAIWIYNSETSIEDATIHEYGHFLDSSLDRVSKSEDFQACYEMEKQAFLLIDQNKYHIESAQEYFAETFELFIKSPRKLKRSCPATYEFFKSLI